MAAPSQGTPPTRLLADHSWLDRLVSRARVDGYRVVGPAERDGTVLYREIGGAHEIALPSPLPLLPLKDVFLVGVGPVVRGGPATDGDRAAGREPRTLILGSRPCEAAALGVMDRFFAQTSLRDHFVGHRRGTVVVSFACSRPDAHCFCTSVGGSPTSGDGSDILVHHLGRGRLRLEPQTAAGHALARMIGGAVTDPGLASEPARPLRPPVKFGLRPAVAALRARLDSASSDEDDTRCQGCGVCRFVCPTCHCFELGGAPEWCCGVGSCDHGCCSVSLFAADRASRAASSKWQEWLLHKFVFFPERFGRLACVGCGRCLRACGMGKSLVRVLQQAEGAAHASGRVASQDAVQPV